MNASVSTEIATVYRSRDGGIHHARCGRQLALRGRRGSFGPEMELAFYCLACAESVSLPLCVLERILVANEAEDFAA